MNTVVLFVNTWQTVSEQVIRARMSISECSKKTGITRKALYAMFKGERTPRLDTVGKLLKELGYTLQVA